MSEQTWWGLVFFLYILAAGPRYLSATGDYIQKVLDEKALDQFLGAWIVGFGVLLIAYLNAMTWWVGAIGSFTTWGICFFIARKFDITF
jgi:hypothetical protein